MITVVGIRFQKAGKIYYFDPCEFDLETGMHVIVETARGVEMGTVLIPPKEVEDEKVIQPLKPVLRVATDEDEQQVERNHEKEKEAFVICKEKIQKHELEMKLVNVEYTFDNNKLLFYFTADGRIDFRELVKDLAAVFRTRIELRQIGVRDETKILGGIGICGRPLCCKTYLSDFVPVSIKMAKEQNLSLNPTKISGVCGRLMCCLKNEQDTYEFLNSRLPSVGDTVFTKEGEKGEVQSVGVLRQIVKVIIDTGEEKELREYKVEELKFRPKKRKDVKLTEEELKELEGLEDSGTVEETDTKPERPKRNFNKEKNHYQPKNKQGDEETQKETDVEAKANVESEYPGESENGVEQERGEWEKRKERRSYQERSRYKHRENYEERETDAEGENGAEQERGEWEKRKERRSYQERSRYKHRENYQERETDAEGENGAEQEHGEWEKRKERRSYQERSRYKHRENHAERMGDAEGENSVEQEHSEWEKRKERRSYQERNRYKHRENHVEGENNVEQENNSEGDIVEQGSNYRPYYKKRYDGKGKRYFGKNKQRNYNSTEE